MERNKPNTGIIIISEKFMSRSKAALAGQKVNGRLAETGHVLTTDRTLAKMAEAFYRHTSDDVFLDTKYATRRRGSRRLPGYGSR